MSKSVQLNMLCVALTLISLTCGCAQKQLTAQQAREKYGSPYSRPKLLARSPKKKLRPVPIDPALLKSSSPSSLSSDVLPAGHEDD